MQAMATGSSHAPGGQVPLNRWLVSPLAHLQILVCLAVVLGGGGVAYGLRNAAIQLVALAILWWHRDHVGRFMREAPLPLVILVFATLALPLLQLVPLPPEIWQQLPGRADVVTAYAIAGLPTDSWLPLSLDRGRTLVAFCGTFAPAAIIIVAASFGRDHKAQLAWTLAGAALVALLLGTFQLTTANTSGLLYPVTAKDNVLYATFANRNSTALLFVLAMLLLSAVPMYRGRGGLLYGTVAIGLLCLGAILTQSRSGMALAGVAVGFVILRLVLGYWQARRARYVVNRPALLVAGFFTLVAAAAIAISAQSGGRAADSLERLTSNETDRPQIWDDTLYAAQVYWPVGSGMGTFDEAFQLHESLEYVSPRRAGRAHNDWLEIGMEAGVAGLILALGWLVWCAQAALFGRYETRWMRLGAGLGIACIAGQSVLDYPLRNQTLLCVAALLVVLLSERRRRRA